MQHSGEATMGRVRPDNNVMSHQTNMFSHQHPKNTMHQVQK